jgi:hypothetical protein
VVPLTLKLGDHYNRKHYIMLIETPHCMGIAEQDGCVDDVSATA